jgi:hypothetical protein
MIIHAPITALMLNRHSIISNTIMRKGVGSSRQVALFDKEQWMDGEPAFRHESHQA